MTIPTHFERYSGAPIYSFQYASCKNIDLATIKLLNSHDYFSITNWFSPI
jgi:hypothetical protein